MLHNPPTYTDWGTTHYQTALQQQLSLLQQRIQGSIPNQLIFTEHYPTYTIGARLNASHHLLWSPSQLQQENIQVFPTNRGGDITYHGPGQLVAYPIIDISLSKDLNLYLRNLEQTIINALSHFGITSHRTPGKTGIWIQNRKIAAIGVAVKRWVTYHGFALNINPNLHHFSGIIPCGIPSSEASVTSLQNELPSPSTIDLPLIKSIIASEFWNIFST